MGTLSITQSILLGNPNTHATLIKLIEYLRC